jgi:uncharacterized membrane protein YdjX (TVP38/TMEM64 family)
MSETKALVLLFISTFALAGTAGAILALTNASGAVFGFVAVVLAALGGFASSCVVMHYGKVGERREREEILLRR